MSFGSMHEDYLDPDSYGLFDETNDNSAVEDAFPDVDGLYDLYRKVYKYTDCGASVKAKIFFYSEAADPEGYPGESVKWFRGDDLRQWGSFKDMAKEGALIIRLAVDSIVEGTDAVTQTYEIDCDGFHFTPKSIMDNFWDAVEEVELEADEIWYNREE